MSYRRGMAALRLEMPDRIPHTEYVSHWELVRHLTGLDPSRPDQAAEAWRRFYLAADYDFLFRTNDGPVPWQERGRTTDMGHAEWLEDGSDRRDIVPSPFHTVEDVLAFDAVEEYGLPDFDELVAFYEDDYRTNQQRHPELVFPGGYYKTIVSGCIQAFGWEMFLTAVGADPEGFDRVLEGIFRLSQHHFRAWARTSIRAFICHDDMVWSQGAIFRPAWYREHIFPRYRKLWQILHDAGKIVLFCSDGDFTQFVDDLADAGADGFIFEPLTSLEYVVERYGRSKVIIGNADARILTFGDKEAIRAEVKRCTELGRHCPGYFMAVGNHIPPNIPLENALYYLDCVRESSVR
ncbi:MAG: hypothetical protein HPY83_17885 [Anaerolineae bacterium]|nr:hypothetical protein [Anaerolineae bacterium]